MQQFADVLSGGESAAAYSGETCMVCKQRASRSAAGQAVAGNAWHADHILPVFRGGGLCTLENLRTLCVVCHQVRAASRARF